MRTLCQMLGVVLQQVGRAGVPDLPEPARDAVRVLAQAEVPLGQV